MSFGIVFFGLGTFRGVADGAAFAAIVQHWAYYAVRRRTATA